MSEPVLSVRNLTTVFDTDDGLVKAVTDVSFDLFPGEVLSIVGESGSGKSVTAMAMMRLLPRSAEVSGQAIFDGVDLLGMSDEEMRSIRGNDIAMIFQDPMTALNPVHTVGNQISEAILTHRNIGRSAAAKEAVELLDLVGIPLPHQRVNQYPHEFSGGMRQRAMIAIAISNRPKVLIADEPTTALDVTIQAQVLDVMQEVQQETGAAMILITHDLGLVAGTANRIQVMYGGRIFESGTTHEIFYESANPYTRGLLHSIPVLNRREADRLYTIRGAPPSLINLPKGCAFRPRCDYATPVCEEDRPDLLPVMDSAEHLSRCHHRNALDTMATAGTA
jgi:peptide/nickel transport system ATP-binding protein